MDYLQNSFQGGVLIFLFISCYEDKITDCGIVTTMSFWLLSGPKNLNIQLTLALPSQTWFSQIPGYLKRKPFSLDMLSYLLSASHSPLNNLELFISLERLRQWNVHVHLPAFYNSAQLATKSIVFRNRHRHRYS